MTQMKAANTIGQINEKIAIITDSCADVPQEWVERFHLFILPLVISCKDGDHHDGVDIFPSDIYQRLKTELPKTSTPSGEDIMVLFDRIKSEGYTKAIAILLSGGLSGTVNHVRLAAEDVEDLEIVTIDSHSGSIGIGAIAIMAADFAQQGMPFDEIVSRTQKMITQTHIFFSIDTLEYLEKGGRIGKAAALTGSLLNIKPILTVDPEDGQITTVTKVRGHKMVPKKLLALAEELKENGRPYNIMVADGGLPEERKPLEKELEKLFPDYHYYIKTNIGATLSAYIGPGILGVAVQYID